MTAAADPLAALEELRRRVAVLEAERRRAFEEAQREADALFAQYQLSQLTAAGGTASELGGSVVLELVRLAAAAGGGIWTGAEGLARLASLGDPPPSAVVPERFADLAAVRSWSDTISGTQLLTLSDDPATVLVLWAPPGGRLDEDGVRVAQLARHELGVALRDAGLRELLDRERAELGAIVEAATDVILGCDADGRITRLNPAGRRLLGLPVDDPLGRPCEVMLGCAGAGGHGPEDCPLRRVAASGEPLTYEETAVRASHGGAVRMTGSYAPLAPGTGEVRAGATAILRDVGAARALEELREGFVATVSHELRTPLALVRGYAETLRHLELEPARQREIVERIEQVSERLAGLVDEILDVTHLTADPLVLERAPVAFGSLLARVRGDLAHTDLDRRLVVVAPERLPPLDVDLPRIGRVLENLLSNALKYSPAGSAIRVELAATAGRVSIVVEDEGVGVPEEERGLVLEPFHRAWNVRESRIPGTGLGLYIGRRLVEAHGGTLTLGDRADGRPGTRVAIDLPASPLRQVAP